MIESIAIILYAAAAGALLDKSGDDTGYAYTAALTAVGAASTLFA